MFIRKADVELAVDGVCFPAHTDVLLVQCGALMEGLIEQYLPSPAPMASTAAAREPPGALPRIVISDSKGAGTADQGAGKSIVTPQTLQLFLNHLYDRGATIDSVRLLQCPPPMLGYCS